MSSIGGTSMGPRASTLSTARAALSQIARTNSALHKAQAGLASGLAIQRPSDDSVRASAIAMLDDRIERSLQHQRNLDHASGTLDIIDSAIGEVHELILTGKDIALEQVNFGSSPEERENQAIVVDQLIRSLLSVASREGMGGYVFGGSAASGAPVGEFLGGYRFQGTQRGLTTDLSLASSVPVTVAASNSIGALSARVRGDTDLNPELTEDTRLADLRGSRGLGVRKGAVDLAIGAGPRLRVDLSQADTIGDVADALEHAIRGYEQSAGIVALQPGGVSVSGAGLAFELVDDPSARLTFFDPEGGTTAGDLGLLVDDPTDLQGPAARGGDVDPRLTWRSPLRYDPPLGQIRVRNAGQSALVDLSNATTLQDVRAAIEGAGLGLRVQINDTATGIDVLSEVSHGRAGAMAIEEVEGNELTATRLGIRTLTATTRLGDFNEGRGVGIVDGRADPISGQIQPELNIDFDITLGDGRTFSVDLRPEDTSTVQTLLDRINAQAQAQGVQPDDFLAEVATDGNGIVLRQANLAGDPVRVEARNGSFAAEDLGLLAGAYDPATGALQGKDRAMVRVDSLFSALMDLRDSLRSNDVTGIGLAGEALERHVNSAVEMRALVGGYARRVEDAGQREEQRMLIDEKTRSEARDLDYAEASVRFNLLQTQLQAGLQSAAVLQQTTLLDFLR